MNQYMLIIISNPMVISLNPMVNLMSHPNKSVALLPGPRYEIPPGRPFEMLPWGFFVPPKMGCCCSKC